MSICRPFFIEKSELTGLVETLRYVANITSFKFKMFCLLCVKDGVTSISFRHIFISYFSSSSLSTFSLLPSVLATRIIISQPPLLETLHVASSLSTDMLKTGAVILGAQLNLVVLTVQVDLRVRDVHMFLLINSSQLPICRLVAKPLWNMLLGNTLIFISGDWVCQTCGFLYYAVWTLMFSTCC